MLGRWYVLILILVRCFKGRKWQIQQMQDMFRELCYPRQAKELTIAADCISLRSSSIPLIGQPSRSKLTMLSRGKR